MTTNAERVKALVDQQAAKGLAKYGHGLEHSPLSLSQLARYAAEEAVDMGAYLLEMQVRAEALEKELAAVRAIQEIPADSDLGILIARAEAAEKKSILLRERNNTLMAETTKAHGLLMEEIARLKSERDELRAEAERLREPPINA